MTEEKLCPLYSNRSFGVCKKESCGFWIDDWKICAIVGLVRELNEIRLLLEVQAGIQYK